MIGQHGQPLLRRLRLLVAIIAGAGVATTELWWPGAAAALHDGVVLVGIVSAWSSPRHRPPGGSVPPQPPLNPPPTPGA
jgi:hypothetical protein